MATAADGRARQTVRRLLNPRWLTMHVLVWAAVVVMVELGRWQLRVSDRKHFDLQNFSYVLQWWAFAACTVAFWLRAMYNVHRPPAAATPPGGALAVRPGSAGEISRRVQSGPAELVAPARGAHEAAVYRGYVIPLSAQVPYGSEGDDHHALYNDYLWQLSMADAVSTQDRASFYPRANDAGDDANDAPAAAPAVEPRVIDAVPLGRADRLAVLADRPALSVDGSAGPADGPAAALDRSAVPSAGEQAEVPPPIGR